jgi:hypothetical protein
MTHNLMGFHGLLQGYLTLPMNVTGSTILWATRQSIYKTLEVIPF